MNLNKAFVLGRLTRDPEVRALPSGQNVASFGLATNRVWNDKDGNRQEATEFHNVVLFGRLADVASQYLQKGALCLIAGRIQTRSWDAQDGQKRYRTEIIGEEMQLGPRAGGAETPAATEKKGSSKKKDDKSALDTLSENEVDVEDIPF